jgi:hypothetical protein
VTFVHVTFGGKLHNIIFWSSFPLFILFFYPSCFSVGFPSRRAGLVAVVVAGFLAAFAVVAAVGLLLVGGVVGEVVPERLEETFVSVAFGVVFVVGAGGEGGC